MIDVGHHCCGCSACVQKCPKHCIRMEEDAEGFKYPIIDANNCVNCNLCEKVCPVIVEKSSNKPIECFAGINPNKEVRLQSSSGGVFTMLAEAVISDGGVVFGAAWDERWRVVHKYTETKEGLAAFRGSKYIQSIIGDTYKQTEQFLKAGRQVLFSGTPCQVSGLHKFLRKDYDNLFTVDFICHGVPSPGVFRWYLQEELNKHVDQKGGKKKSVSFSPISFIPKENVLLPEGIRIEDIRFRDKREGWKKFSFVLTLTEVSADGKQNSVSLSYVLNRNKFLDGFFNDIYLRPCCYDCQFKQYKTFSDITIGDFWNIGTYKRTWDDDKGVSYLLCNTEKGVSVIKSLDIGVLKVDLGIIELRNSAILNPAKLDIVKRNAFFANSHKGFMERVDELCKPSLKQKMYKTVYGILETIGILRIVHIIKYHNR